MKRKWLGFSRKKFDWNQNPDANVMFLHDVTLAFLYQIFMYSPAAFTSSTDRLTL